MATKKRQRKKSIFETPRYWYHISTTLTNKREYLRPWDNNKGFNRADSEPNVKRTCVAPTVAHCLTAVPYVPGEDYVVYRTERKMKATQGHGIFDADVTHEGWIQIPTIFVKVGVLSLPAFAEKANVTLVDEAASGGDTRNSGRVLKWWQRRKVERFIKRT